MLVWKGSVMSLLWCFLLVRDLFGVVWLMFWLFWFIGGGCCEFLKFIVDWKDVLLSVGKGFVLFFLVDCRMLVGDIVFGRVFEGRFVWRVLEKLVVDGLFEGELWDFGSDCVIRLRCCFFDVMGMFFIICGWDWMVILVCVKCSGLFILSIVLLDIVLFGLFVGVGIGEGLVLNVKILFNLFCVEGCLEGGLVVFRLSILFSFFLVEGWELVFCEFCGLFIFVDVEGCVVFVLVLDLVKFCIGCFCEWWSNLFVEEVMVVFDFGLCGEFCVKDFLLNEWWRCLLVIWVVCEIWELIGFCFLGFLGDGSFLILWL